jgi:hypothetical protein
MTRMMKMAGKASSIRGVLGALFLVLYVSATGEAKARDGGDGAKNKPFNALQQAEAASLPGDTIYILPSPAADVLDGGIQLKDGQKLLGEGPAVTRAAPHSARG